MPILSAHRIGGVRKDIDILDISGKTRKVSVGNDTQKVWERIKSILRNPVIIKFQLAEDIL